MTESVRRAVAERAHRRCEYCQCPDQFSTSPYDVEHIVPRFSSGTDDLQNLAWSCSGCNGSKGVAVEAIDPLTGHTVSLFHPRQDNWAEHLSWSVEWVFVVGLTPIGRATIERMNLNRSVVVNLRYALVILGIHPPQ